MADPLRRTLLAKLRGKKSKKGTAHGGGYGSAAAAAAAAAHGGHEGKEKVLQTRRGSRDTRPVVLLDFTAGRMSTYENCVDGAAVRTGGVLVVAEGRAAERAGSRPQQTSGGGRVRDHDELPGVPLQRDAQPGEGAFREEDGSRRGSGSPAGVQHGHRRHFVSFPRQCSVGDSIGFGDNSNNLVYQVQAHPGVSKAAPAADGERTEHGDLDGGPNNANCSCDSPAVEKNRPSCAPPVHPNCVSRSAEENVLFRDIESFNGPGCLGDFRGTAGGLQNPTFFPTELQICDIKMASFCATQGALRYPLDSEDEDYYDNEILPFYETVRQNSDGGRVDVSEPGQDRGKGDEGSSAQETDRLRNQLQEAYYLLINAMNDINLDEQQISGGLTEQQATSSSSSQSRDSLSSRLSVKNMDSDSWSSGGDQSPQQVSDTDSLLLCLAGNLESQAKLNSKSMVNLTLTRKPRLLRSASDGAIRYQVRPSACSQAPEVQSDNVCDGKEATGTKEAEGVDVTRAGELSEPQVLCSAAAQGAGGEEDRGEQLDESSGSVNSLTGSSDSNAEAAAHLGQDSRQETTEARAQAAGSVNKANGVTVNKMQAWMHKGRLLSSEMKQRIEGSSLPCGQIQDRPCPQAHPGGCKPGVQTPGRGGKSVKTKSPPVKSQRQQQPGREATRHGLDSRGSSHPSDYHPPPLIVNFVWWRSALQSSSSGCKAKGRDTSDLLLSFYDSLTGDGFCPSH